MVLTNAGKAAAVVDGAVTGLVGRIVGGLVTAEVVVTTGADCAGAVEDGAGTRAALLVVAP